MKNKIIAGLIVALGMSVSPSVYAEEIVEDSTSSVDVSEPSEESTESPNIDTLPPPSEELIQQNPWQESSSAQEGEVPAGQDEPETWAVVDENGNTLNTIVCDIDFCGSGWIPISYDGFTPNEWARVVLQAARDPETGKNNGGHQGQYNFTTNTWTNQNDRGEIYQVPIEYGENPFCIENCLPVEDPRDTMTPPPGDEGIWDGIFDNNEVVAQNSLEVSGKSIEAKVNNVKNRISFRYNVSSTKKIKNNIVRIIAKNDYNKKSWKFKINNSGKVLVALPIRYLDWDISISYKLKNNKRINEKIILKN
jgi:hypothetical protein